MKKKLNFNLGEWVMIIPVKTSHGEYNIVLQRGILNKADTYLKLNRKVFIVTDSGVPKEYS